MPKGKKRLTQREKAERAAIKKQLKKEGREQYSIGEYVEKVYNPVMNL